jgi:hypothetical protein
VGVTTDFLSTEEQTTLAYQIVADIRRMITRLGVNYGEITTATGYQAMLVRLQNAANAQHVNGPWQSIITQLTSEQNSVILEGIADALPNEGDPIDLAAVEKALAEVDELTSSLLQSEIPAFHKHYAQMLLGQLRIALRQYSVFGAQSIHEYAAFSNGIVADLNANSAALTESQTLEPSDQTLIDRLSAVSQQVTEWSKKIYYVGGASAMLYHGATPALSLLGRVIN